MLTVVRVLPSAPPPVGLPRMTLKLVSLVTNASRSMGTVMVFTVSFCPKARVPETAWWRWMSQGSSGDQEGLEAPPVPVAPVPPDSAARRMSETPWTPVSTAVRSWP